MTDSERAEEYVKTNHSHIMSGTMKSVYEKIYLDGLLEGKKEKWHDLREDSNDLPKESGEYWCKWEDGTYCTTHYFEAGGFGDYVIAWCELPKFEE